MSDSQALSTPRVLPPHYFFTGLLLLFGLAFIPGPQLLPFPWPHLGWLVMLAGLAFAIRGNRLEQTGPLAFGGLGGRGGDGDRQDQQQGGSR